MKKWIILTLVAFGVIFAIIFRSDIIQIWNDYKTKELTPIDAKQEIVVDSIRHYFPVRQGETLKIAYAIYNKSKDNLVIQEVQTSCGCLVSRDELPMFILSGDTGYVHADFNTTKNIGYVAHYIQCFGNFKNADSISIIDEKGKEKWAKFIELHFDTNVVPPSDYHRDYEEVWHEQASIDATIRDFVDGKSSQKDYWLDKDTIGHREADQQ